MRVIEPGRHGVKKKVKFRKKLPRTPKLILIVVLVLGAGYILVGQTTRDPMAPAKKEETVNSPSPANVRVTKDSFKVLNGEGFKKLYNAARYPNTQQFDTLPDITGDYAADSRIRQLAEARGYKPSSIPESNIVKTGEPYLSEDDLMQPLALMAWKKMKAAAKTDGLDLRITSAYRSPEFQRDLFLTRLYGQEINIASINSGMVDAEIVQVLSRAAIPGYSRHHTGYTMDLSCGNVGLENFKSTACYAWLSNNNYQHAKEFGWIPSYPEEANQQGPEPEAWEYIWVGTEILKNTQ